MPPTAVVPPVEDVPPMPPTAVVPPVEAPPVPAVDPPEPLSEPPVASEGGVSPESPLSPHATAIAAIVKTEAQRVISLERVMLWLNGRAASQGQGHAIRVRIPFRLEVLSGKVLAVAERDRVGNFQLGVGEGATSAQLHRAWPDFRNRNVLSFPEAFGRDRCDTRQTSRTSLRSERKCPTPIGCGS